MSCRTEPSRSREPGLPWKYLLVTMFVAVCDQLFGTSTSSWRKIVTPFSFPISAVRFSHSTASNGEIFPSVKYLSKGRPLRAPAPAFSRVVSVIGEFPVIACFTVAIPFLRTFRLPLFAGEPFNFNSTQPHSAGCWEPPEGHRKVNPSPRTPDQRKRRPLGSRPSPRPPRGHVKNPDETPMLCRWPVGLTQPHSNSRA